MDVLLIQPRHIYAPPQTDGEIGHVYMPTSLLTAAARLQMAGVDLRFIDENIEQAASLPHVIGVNVVGAPYVSSTLAILCRLHLQHQDGIMLLGGQGVSGFSGEQKQRLWGTNVFDGNDDITLAACVEIDPSRLPTPESTSLVPIYATIPDELMRLYLSEEFGFYLSQGCRFECSFCAADRTRFDPQRGLVRRVSERYRRLNVVMEDLQYLISRAKELGLGALRLYLSNLDLFQSPHELANFASAVMALRRNSGGFEIRMRALATTTSFLSVHRRFPNTMADIVSAGLYRLGFGIDGATRQVWSAIKKPQRSMSCLDSIRIASGEYHLQTEALMVFGHNSADDAMSLGLATDILRRLRADYGAIPRPHVAKSVVPGNDGWADPANADMRDYLIRQPRAFQMLDFTALPSWLTHPNQEFRRLVSAAFIDACSIDSSRTQYVYPEDPESSVEERSAAHDFNERRYDV